MRALLCPFFPILFVLFMSLQLPSKGTPPAALPPTEPLSQVPTPVAQPSGIAQPPAATPTDGHVISASEWRGGREISDTLNFCPESFGDLESSYILQTSDFLNLTFEHKLKLDFIVPMVYGTVVFSVDEQAVDSFTSGSCAPMTFTWPETSITGAQNLSISVESVVVIGDDDEFRGDGGPVSDDDVSTRDTQFTIIILNAVDRATVRGTGVPDIPATAEPPDSTAITGSAPISSGLDSAPPKDASFSTSSSKARIIVPVVVVPVVLLLAGLITFFLRRRHRAKTAPSKVFKAENPTFRRIETWVPIDDKRVFSADAEHGVAGSSS